LPKTFGQGRPVSTSSAHYSYGPVPSRRLGKSLGINNIPAKACSYACIYCQVGKTTQMQLERSTFYEPEDIFRDVQKRVAKMRRDNHVSHRASILNKRHLTIARCGTGIAFRPRLGFR